MARLCDFEDTPAGAQLVGDANDEERADQHAERPAPPSMEADPSDQRHGDGTEQQGVQPAGNGAGRWTRRRCSGGGGEDTGDPEDDHRHSGRADAGQQRLLAG